VSYYADLTPYEYFGSAPDCLNVGWLEAPHGFPVGEPNPELIRRLAEAARYSRVNQTRGYHVCSLCSAPKVGRPIRVGWRWIRLGSAELRVRAQGVTYASPDLIVHYIRDHSYAPPGQFIDAVMNPPGTQP
jgi:hypothetical protein